MADNPLFELASQRYEQEVSYSQFLDQKASNQTGFGGIITGIIATMFGYGVFSGDIRAIHPDVHFLELGLVLLLISMAIGIIALTPFVKTRKLFNVEKFYNNFKDDSPEEKIEGIFQTYLLMISRMQRINNQKALILYCGSACMLAGIVFSFISMVELIRIIG